MHQSRRAIRRPAVEPIQVNITKVNPAAVVLRYWAFHPQRQARLPVQNYPITLRPGGWEPLGENRGELEHQLLAVALGFILKAANGAVAAARHERGNTVLVLPKKGPPVEFVRSQDTAVETWYATAITKRDFQARVARL